MLLQLRLNFMQKFLAVGPKLIKSAESRSSHSSCLLGHYAYIYRDMELEPLCWGLRP